MFKKKFLAFLVLFGALQAAQTLRLKKLNESEFKEYSINSDQDAWRALKPVFDYASPGYQAFGTFVLYDQGNKPLVFKDGKKFFGNQGESPHIVKIGALYQEKGYPVKPSLNLNFVSNSESNEYLFKNKSIENSLWIDGSWVKVLDLKFEQVDPNEIEKKSVKSEEKSYIAGELIPVLEKDFQLSKSSEKITGGLSAPVKIVHHGRACVWDEKSNQMVKSDELSHKQIFQLHWKANDDKSAVQIEIWTGGLELKVSEGELNSNKKTLNLNFDGQMEDVMSMLSPVVKNELASNINNLQKYRTGINNSTKVMQNNFKNKVQQRKKLNKEIEDIKNKIKVNIENIKNEKSRSAANNKLKKFMEDKVKLRKKLNEELKPLGPQIKSNGKTIKDNTQVIKYLQSF